MCQVGRRTDLKAGYTESKTALVRRRLLDAVDDDELHLAALGFQLQPQLLLERGEERCAIDVRSDGAIGSGCHALRGECQDEVVGAGQSRAIDDGTIRAPGQ